MVLISVVVLSFFAFCINSDDECVESEQNISADFPFESKYIDVLGSSMHYIDVGSASGDPMLFLHGNPTSVYLWRNIIPHVQSQARVIAVDLIGMGKSDKLESGDYGFLTHYKYIEAFIAELGLKKITLVVHDCGSFIGFLYASRNQGNVKGIAFMESMAPPSHPYASYDVLTQEMAQFLRMAKYGDEATVDMMFITHNIIIEQVIPQTTVRQLTEEEMNHYRAPFVDDPEDRRVLLQFPQENAVAGEPVDVWNAEKEYNEWLESTQIPKLQLYGSPGGINSVANVVYNQQNLDNYESVFIGAAKHFVQEDHPEKIGRAIADWHRRNILKSNEGNESTLVFGFDMKEIKDLVVMGAMVIIVVFTVYNACCLNSLRAKRVYVEAEQVV